MNGFCTDINDYTTFKAGKNKSPDLWEDQINRYGIHFLSLSEVFPILAVVDVLWKYNNELQLTCLNLLSKIHIY